MEISSSQSIATNGHSTPTAAIAGTSSTYSSSSPALSGEAARIRAYLDANLYDSNSPQAVADNLRRRAGLTSSRLSTPDRVITPRNHNSSSSSDHAEILGKLASSERLHSDLLAQMSSLERDYFYSYITSKYYDAPGRPSHRNSGLAGPLQKTSQPPPPPPPPSTLPALSSVGPRAQNETYHHQQHTSIPSLSSSAGAEPVASSANEYYRSADTEVVVVPEVGRTTVDASVSAAFIDTRDMSTSMEPGELVTLPLPPPSASVSSRSSGAKTVEGQSSELDDGKRRRKKEGSKSIEEGAQKTQQKVTQNDDNNESVDSLSSEDGSSDGDTTESNGSDEELVEGPTERKQKKASKARNVRDDVVVGSRKEAGSTFQNTTGSKGILRNKQDVYLSPVRDVVVVAAAGGGERGTATAASVRRRRRPVEEDSCWRNVSLQISCPELVTDLLCCTENRSSSSRRPGGEEVEEEEEENRRVSGNGFSGISTRTTRNDEAACLAIKISSS